MLKGKDKYNKVHNLWSDRYQEEMFTEMYDMYYSIYILETSK